MGENQTNPEVLLKVSTSQKGSGVFAIPNPAEGSEQISKVIVNDITYQECVRRGRLCIAFRWVPKQLPKDQTACPVPDQLCVNTCVHDTCLCIDGLCQ